MANIETAIYARMSGFAGLTALVGTKIYPGKMPQEPTYPAIVYFKISNPDHPAQGRTDDILRPRFQINVVAPTYSSAKAVKAQVWEALHDWGPVTQSGVEVLDAAQLTENDEGWNDDVKVYTVSMDYIVSHIKE